MRDQVRQKAETLAARRGCTRPQAEAWAVDQYLAELVKSGRMALMGRVATPLQTAKRFGGHQTELEALNAALDRALAASS
jgi:hypothetical protein